MSISRLEAELLEAQARYNTMKNVPLKESIAAKQTHLSAERALSLAKGEETALACEWEVLWEANAPMPHVMTAARKTYVLLWGILETPLVLSGSLFPWKRIPMFTKREYSNLILTFHHCLLRNRQIVLVELPWRDRQVLRPEMTMLAIQEFQDVTISSFIGQIAAIAQHLR